MLQKLTECLKYIHKNLLQRNILFSPGLWLLLSGFISKQRQFFLHPDKFSKFCIDEEVQLQVFTKLLAIQFTILLYQNSKQEDQHKSFLKSFSNIEHIQ